MTEQQKALQEQGVQIMKIKIEVDIQSFLDDIREGVQQIAQEAARDFLLGEMRRSLEAQSKPGGLLFRSWLTDQPPGMAYSLDPATGAVAREEPADQLPDSRS